MKYAAEIIDDLRADYAAGLVSREDAIYHIRVIVNVTERGAADLLDHPESSTVRYGRIGWRS